ncbi:hypothetical protein IPF37_00935 [bacterium]|nr:MAG: hypothetical protein IPF37_00935 [bacterium]
MKTIKLSFLLIAFLTTIAQADKQKNEPGYLISPAFNQLKKVAVTHNELSTQITFDFSQPIYFKQKLNEAQRTLKLWFPGMNLKNFNPQHVMDKINQLKTTGLIDTIEINEKDKAIPNVMLTLKFTEFRTHYDTNKNNTESQIPNKKQNRLLIKWSQTEEPNQLILDIFSVESLEKIKAKNSVLLHAKRTNHATERSTPSNQAWRFARNA